MERKAIGVLFVESFSKDNKPWEPIGIGIKYRLGAVPQCDPAKVGAD